MDLLIENAKIVDGSGSPWYKGSILIKDDLIARITSTHPSREVRRVDAKGLTVTPGFIDSHTHSDFCLLKNPRLDHKLSQGVTTEVIGLCGFSAAPIDDKFMDEFRQFVSPFFGGEDIRTDWRGMDEFLRMLVDQGTGPNVASFVGHSVIRIAVMGSEDRRPTGEELTRMKRLVTESMLEGAIGMSSGLMYPPGSYAEIAELVELARIASQYDGIYATHVRSLQNAIIPAVEEAILIGSESSAPVIISHIQSNSRKFWGKSLEVLDKVEDSRSRGVDVAGDVHPYLAGSTLLTQLLPPWASSGGVTALLSRLADPVQREEIRKAMEESTDYDNYCVNLSWDDIRIAHFPGTSEYEGLAVKQIAAMKKKDPYETVFDLLTESRCQATMILFMCAEEEKVYTMRHPLTMIASDCLAVYPNKGMPHPRAYGTFPLVLGHYVRQRKIMPLEEAVRKMTSLPAQRLRLRGRGLIGEGMSADMVIFDEEKIEDKASYADPHRYSEGIEYVIINGEIVLEEGHLNDALPGRVIVHGTRQSERETSIR